MLEIDSNWLIQDSLIKERSLENLAVPDWTEQCDSEINQQAEKQLDKWHKINHRRTSQEGAGCMVWS